MRHPDEPHILIGAVLVHVGAVDLLTDLLASGHRVGLDANGVAFVEPRDDVRADMLYLLDDAFAEDCALALGHGGVTVS